jgi:indole-3-glycerol phosphate synthase/phosphoribosylanthranilate isomerase
MKTELPAQAARELVFGRVKLCGLNNVDIERAARPASFAGFVLVEGTPRAVAVEQAAELASAMRSFGILPVAVFRDSPLEQVVTASERIGVHAVQLHGREDADYIEALRRQLPGTEIWTAVSVGRDKLESRGGDRLLFDNGVGGSGQAFDWSLVAGHPELGASVLAGGIGPHNVRAAAKVGAYAIDVGSGVDERPGVKSAEKITALFEALRPASRERLAACA